MHGQNESYAGLLAELEEQERRLATLKRIQAKLSSRCGAVWSSGRVCRNRVLPGEKRCRWHGGWNSTPEAREMHRQEMLAKTQRLNQIRWTAYREGRNERAKDS